MHPKIQTRIAINATPALLSRLTAPADVDACAAAVPVVPAWHSAATLIR